MSLKTEQIKSEHLVFWATLRGMAGALFEQPLDVAKARSQRSPRMSPYQILSEIFNKNGIAGFGHGFVPNLQKRVVKESLRWSAINQLYPQYKKAIGNELASKAATITTVVALEVLALPIDRFFQAKVNESGYRTYFQNIKSLPAKSKFSALYRGAAPFFINRLFAWQSFIFTDHYLKRCFVRWDKDNRHPYLRQLATTTITAANLSFLALPFEATKTRIQLDPTNTFSKMRWTQVIIAIYGQEGLRGFYSAIPFDVSKKFIHVAFSVALFDKIIFSHSNA